MSAFFECSIFTGKNDLYKSILFFQSGELENIKVSRHSANTLCILYFYVWL